MANAFKQLISALILFYGAQYLISHYQQTDSISFIDQKSSQVVERAISLSDSKRKFLPVLLELYTSKCSHSLQSNTRLNVGKLSALHLIGMMALNKG
jgi:uncharacterized protein YpiB (UPF0302 family)